MAPVAPQMSDLERRVLNVVQEGFPLAKRPFAEIGARIGISEEEVLAALGRLKEKGIVRRLGASFDSKKLGYATTLVGMQVPQERLDEVAGLVSEFPEVTHNYARDHQINLWFALVARDQTALQSAISDIRRRTGIDQLFVLPAKRRFKVRVRFEF